MRKPGYSAIGLVLLAALLIAVIAFGNTVLRGVRADLTEDSLYTLSEGSRKIMNRIDVPMNLYFFYSEETARNMSGVQLYAERIKGMLRRMDRIAGHKLELKVINPEPFSKEADRAIQLGVRPMPLGNGKNLYFGLAATNAIGDTRAIPFFSKNRRALLEYDVAELIYQLDRKDRPTVGLLSPLQVAGSKSKSPVKRLFQTDRKTTAKPAWTVFKRIQSSFNVQVLPEDLKQIPKEIDLLWLVHPTYLSKTTRYAIDQFVLGGGKALIFVDPASRVAQVAGVDPKSRATYQTDSDLEKLFAAWGLKLRDDMFVADAGYAMQVQAGGAPLYDYAMLRVPEEGLSQSDVITRSLSAVNVASAGILESTNASDGITVTPLIRSSDRAEPMPARILRPAMNPVVLQRGFEPTGERYTIAVRLRGRATTAFPDGPPGSDDDKAKSNDASADEIRNAPAEDHLTHSQGPINVVVIADTDMLTDRLWVNFENRNGRKVPSPWADNANFVINAIENLLGSNALISIRGQTGYWRPFKVVDAMRREANQKYRATEQRLQQQLTKTRRMLAQLQHQRGPNAGILMSAEQKKAIKRFRQERLEIREQLRAVRHRLNEDIEQLGTILKFINILLVPLLLAVGVLGYSLWRRARPRRSKLLKATSGGRA